jgi:hypothetical protein
MIGTTNPSDPSLPKEKFFKANVGSIKRISLKRFKTNLGRITN